MHYMSVRFLWGENPVTLRLHCITSTNEGDLRGLRCPECRHPLTPVLPATRAKHFRHAFESKCGGGLESVAHRIAKQLLSDGIKLLLPERVCPRWPRPSGHRSTKLLAPPTEVAAISGQQEVTLPSGHRADVICAVRRPRRGLRNVLFEVHAYHSVDEVKAEALRGAGYHAVEIDVPQGLALMSLDQARDYISRTADRRWLSDPTGERWARLSRSKALPAYETAVKALEERRRAEAVAIQQRRMEEISQQQWAFQRRIESEERRACARAEADRVLSFHRSQAALRWKAEPPCPYVAIAYGEQLGRFIGILPYGVIGFVSAPASWQAAALYELFLRPIDNGDDVLDPAFNGGGFHFSRLVSALDGRMRKPGQIICPDFFRWSYGSYKIDPIGWKRQKQLAGFFGGQTGCGTPSYVIAQVASSWLSNLSLLQFWRDQNLGRAKWIDQATDYVR